MKPPTKRILLCIGLILYFGVHVAVRLNGELVHRHTWSNGWSSHWIDPASTDTEAKLAFIGNLLSEDPTSEETQQYAEDIVKKIERRRRVLQCVFIPLVIAESATHWVINPRE